VLVYIKELDSLNYDLVGFEKKNLLIYLKVKYVFVLQLTFQTRFPANIEIKMCQIV